MLDTEQSRKGRLYSDCIATFHAGVFQTDFAKVELLDIFLRNAMPEKIFAFIHKVIPLWRHQDYTNVVKHCTGMSDAGCVHQVGKVCAKVDNAFVFAPLRNVLRMCAEHKWTTVNVGLFEFI